MFFILPWRLQRSGLNRRVPVANVALIAVNVLVYLCGQQWAVGPGTGAVSVLMYGFSHCGFWHLAVNMWALWVFGNPANRRIGNTFYVLAYLGTVVALGLFARLFLGSHLVGSSGALFAVITIALMLMPASVLRVVCIALFPLSVVVGLLARPKQRYEWIVRWADFSVPAIWCLVLLPLVQLWSLLWNGWDWTSVAHLLGMLCGLAVVLLLPARISMRRRTVAGI